MSEKTQIVFIHGGDSFDNPEEFHDFVRSLTYDPYAIEHSKWRDQIKETLIHTHECLMPRMPNAMNADYTAWSIWFEKLFPYLRDGVILVGHSMGGGFLLHYLTENKLPIKISQLHLVAPVIDDLDCPVIDDLDCPGVGEFGIDITNWSGFQNIIPTIHLWHSSDDTLVPIHHSERFLAKLPTVTLHRFTDRGHFLQPEFPELLAELQK
jgi:pimeloyl-ACP methyl ester carboxylesterase